MAVRFLPSAMLAALLMSSVQLVCAKRRAVVAMTFSERAEARFKVEEERMFREEAALRKEMSNMTMDAARKTLMAGGAAGAKLVSLVDEHMDSALSSKLRRASQEYKPTTGIAKARDMLNGMINENNRKLDTLKTECSGFFKKQCSLMETCRDELVSSNSEAATCRGGVLKHQKGINICEFRLPHLKNDLAISIHECNTRLAHLRRDLKIVLGDIEVMNVVLKLTECAESTKKPAMIQMEGPPIVECEHPCTKEAFLAFHHEELNHQLAQLKSDGMRQLVQDGLRELSSPIPAVPVDENGTVIVNVTMFKNPPLKQTRLPDDPCKGITYDAGGKPGCTLRTNPQCFNLQNKFINIQGETVDKRDELRHEIRVLEANCERTQKALRGSIAGFERKHDEETTGLAEDTACENAAVKAAQDKGDEHKDLEMTMLQSRKECTAKMRTLESELCALKKIRGELMKLKGDKHPFFQDCEVAKWEPEDCTVSCGGGIQYMKRGIISPQSGGGAACPPLTMQRGCNEMPCPIDCKLSTWTRWSSCSADCGGGIRERMRKIKVHPRYGGANCGDVTETESCNMQSCDRNCKLGHWKRWGACTKACGGGKQMAVRVVKVAAIGRGTCPSKNSRARLRSRRCNTHRCPVPPGPSVLKCKSKVDLVLLLDGSGSVGRSGWEGTKRFAKKFVEAFSGEDAQVSVILFSGPRTWTNYRKCNGIKAQQVDQEKICGLKMVQHFTNDIKLTQTNIGKLSFPAASTYTAKALEMANAELTLGRKDASRVVLVMTDGIPISPHRTGVAARKLRRRARLMFGAVRLNGRGLRWMQSWSTRPTRDNVMRIRDFRQMEKTSTMNLILRDMCSSVAAPR